MATPPPKRYRNDSNGIENASSEFSIGPDGAFPSEDESSEETGMRDCFFPSEESNTRCDQLSNDLSLSDQEVLITRNGRSFWLHY